MTMRMRMMMLKAVGIEITNKVGSWLLRAFVVRRAVLRQLKPNLIFVSTFLTIF